ncbi:unnamed protein product, partial [Vitis vinifera]
MPLTRLAADAFGVVTICLVSLLTLLGFLCIIYSCYFRTRIHSRGFVQLGYFSVLNALNLKWQETVCKYYIVSNLGFAEPCLFLTLVFLLRAPLQKMDSGILSQKWNGKTAGYVFLCCLPVFALQLIVILIGPDFNKGKNNTFELPHYFTSTARNSDASTKRGSISFRTVEKDGTSVDTYVELSLFSPSRHATPPGSPRPLGWPMVPRAQVHGP